MAESRNAVLVLKGANIAAYGFGDGHPFGPDRHAAFHDELAGRDIEQVDGGLEETQPDQLLDQIAARDDDEQTHHQQQNRDEVGVMTGEGHESSPPASRRRPANT